MPLFVTIKMIDVSKQIFLSELIRYDHICFTHRCEMRIWVDATIRPRRRIQSLCAIFAQKEQRNSKYNHNHDKDAKCVL